MDARWTVISPATAVLIRRLLVQHRERTQVYRDLVLISVLLHQFQNRADATDATTLAPPVPRGGGLYLTPAEVAAYLGITPDGVRKACRTGRLKGDHRPGSRCWRITQAAVADYLAA